MEHLASRKVGAAVRVHLRERCLVLLSALRVAFAVVLRFSRPADKGLGASLEAPSPAEELG
jgi:hypothetical protein